MWLVAYVGDSIDRSGAGSTGRYADTILPNGFMYVLVTGYETSLCNGVFHSKEKK